MNAWRRTAAAAVYLALLALLAAEAPPLHAQPVLVDRLVATIGDQALTWRDVQAARLFGSIPPGGTDADAVTRLVTRELMHLEVERLAVPAPIGAAVDERVSLATQRAGGPEAWARALQALGLPASRARQWIADDLRIDVYMDQRFTAAAQPTDLEVQLEAAPAPGVAATATQLADARRRLVEVRRAALIDDWVAGIRARTPVQLAVPR